MSTTSAFVPPDDTSTFHSDSAAPYTLPNDDREHLRLDRQSQGLVRMMHDQPFHIPPSYSAAASQSLSTRPLRILDVGCGTGSMTLLLARAFPSSQVVGLDLSPVPAHPGSDPDVQWPDNVEFVQGNVRTLCSMSPPDKRFEPRTYDYIFSRALVIGMVDWQGYISDMHTLLREGGWLEVQEPESRWRSPVDDSDTSSTWRWTDAVNRAAMKRGVDMLCSDNMRQRFVHAGFDQVEVHNFRHAYSESLWDEHPDSHEFGIYARQQLRHVFPFMVAKYCQDYHSEEETEIFRRECEETLASNEWRGAFFAWVGEKKA